MARLILTFGNKVLSNHLVAPESEISIGRDPSNDVVIEHPSVSSRHAKIRQTASGVFIADLGSTNGTFVNEDKIVDCQLAHQDWINIGKHILIVDLYETLSLDATVQMLMAGSSGSADAEGTMMLDMEVSGTSYRAQLDYLNFLSSDQPDLELTNKQITIGKNKDADIVIKGFWSLFAGQPSATINKRSGNYILDYVTGVLKPKINGMAIRQPIRLNHHDIISIGPLKMQLYLMR
jgi:pSer/pThr/pTyr-binding forkhead associated (FHA) protein